ncbi:MAG: DUF4430 domain-containing protein [Clostridia bacterium]|nr:DUF4430 domain-containing protein [Clostridia bacterium]
MWFQKNKWKIIVPALIVLALVISFFCGGKMPESAKNQTVATEMTDVESGSEPILDSDILIADESQQPELPQEEMAPVTADETVEAEETLPAEQTEEIAEKPDAADVSAAAEETPAKTEEVVTEAPAEQSAAETPAAEPEQPTMIIDPATGKDQYLTDPVPEGKPLPVEPQNVVVGDAAYTCTISISCETILDNMDLCDEEKVELVPEDGWILQPVRVTFYEGESVFNVLQRACKQNKIHMEFENTPIYNSAYIEGIHNLYEFDVGELSGWMYKVNGWFPNYGCSRYQLKDGDVVCWVYTCDLGCDVGGGYAIGE